MASRSNVKLMEKQVDKMTRRELTKWQADKIAS